MIKLLLYPLFAALSRASGGGIGAHILDKKGEKRGRMPFNMTWLPEAILAILAGAVWGIVNATVLWAIPVAAYIYIIWQSGHGTVYNMKGWDSKDPTRIQTIEWPIRIIFNLFRWNIRTPAYSWAVMGFKGFLIGLPFFPFGVPLAILWPASYAYRDTKAGEWLSGLVFANTVVAFWYAGFQITSFLASLIYQS